MSRRSLDETLSFIAAVDRAASADAVAETVLSVVKPFGFSQVFAGIIPSPGMSMQQQVANVVLHRWPEKWSERYFSQGYLFDDPAIQRVTTSTEPFLWSELEGSYRDRPSAKRIMGEAREFDLGFGFTVPMLTLDGHSAGFSIASDRGELPPHYRGPLQLLAMYAFGRALMLADTPPTVKLTPREADVLHWIAEGKSDWEISKILHVSEHTVDKMARQIRFKFGATNRTQAVAQALRHKIIR
jgi:LuxR family quorum sensing-dependent transcriptional regulator